MPIVYNGPGGGGGSGTVQSVTAADTSITVAGTAANPTVKTGTLDVIAADHPPAADWSNNSHKITSLANGAAASDAAAFGQIPTALPPNGSAGGSLAGTYPSPVLALVFAEITTQESTSSNSFTDLATVGPTVTITVGASGMVVVGWNEQCTGNGTNFSAVSVAVSGASTVAANDQWGLTFSGNLSLGRTYVFTGLSAGSTTFTMKYRSISGVSMAFLRRSLWAVPL